MSFAINPLQDSFEKKIMAHETKAELSTSSADTSGSSITDATDPDTSEDIPNKILIQSSQSADPPRPGDGMIGLYENSATLKRVTIQEDSQSTNSGDFKPAASRFVPAPATPWRSKTLRKTGSNSGNGGASPLCERALPHVTALDLSAKHQRDCLSSAPSSATLIPSQALAEKGWTRSDPLESSPKTAPFPDATLATKGHSRGPICRLPSGAENKRSGARKLGISMPYPNDSEALFGRMHVKSDPNAFSAQQKLFLMQTEAMRLQAAYKMANDRRNTLDFNTEEVHLTNIYITNLSKETDDDALYALGSACGTVISHKAMLDKESGLCKGFGFLMYATHEEATRAIDWLSARGFVSSFAKESFTARLRRMADSSSTNVYLSNLPVKFTVHQFEQLFVPHPIASLKILTDVNGESRGVGFVRLFDRASAEKCIQRLHGRILPGTTQPLQVRFADSEAQKKLKQTVHQKHTLESLGLPRVKRVPDDLFCRPSLAEQSFSTLESTKNMEMLNRYFQEARISAGPRSLLPSVPSFSPKYSLDTECTSHPGVMHPQYSHPFLRQEEVLPYLKTAAVTSQDAHHIFPPPAHSIPVPQYAIPEHLYGLTNMIGSRPEDVHRVGLGAAMPFVPSPLPGSNVASPYANQMYTPPFWPSLPSFASHIEAGVGSAANDYGKAKANVPGDGTLDWLSTLETQWRSHMLSQSQEHSKAFSSQEAQRALIADLHGNQRKHSREHSSSTSIRITVPSLGNTPEKRKKSTPFRVVSDPLAASSARKGLFEDAMGMPIRQRGAVSADNSMEEEGEVSRDASEISANDSNSVDIQINLDRYDGCPVSS